MPQTPGVSADSTDVSSPATSGANETAAKGGGWFSNITPEQQTVLFLALTFIVIVIIAILCPDIFSALAIVAVLIGFAMAFVYASKDNENGAATAVEGFSARTEYEQPEFRTESVHEGFNEGLHEGFSGLPGPTPPYAIAADPPTGGGPMLEEPDDYPGAIDGVDDHDSDAVYGHLDRNEGENADMAYGNIFNRNRVSSPQAADAGLDDEANGAEIDGDELMVFQGRSRNDAERVTAGTMNRRKWLDSYLREGCEESDDQYWWGRHEL